MHADRGNCHNDIVASPRALISIRTDLFFPSGASLVVAIGTEGLATTIELLNYGVVRQHHAPVRVRA